MSIIGKRYTIHTYKCFIWTLDNIREWHQMLWEYWELDRQRGFNHRLSIKRAFISMCNHSKLHIFMVRINCNPMNNILATRLQYAVESLYFSMSPNACFDFCPLEGVIEEKVRLW